MVTFWLWGVRNPFILLGAVFAVAGLCGIFDQALSFSGLMLCGLFADAANHLARRIVARQEQERALAARRNVIQLFRDVDHDSFRKAA